MDVRVTNPSQQAPATLGSFNAAPAQDAGRTALACCASGTFAKAIAGGRPYPDPAALLAAVDAAFRVLSWDDIVPVQSPECGVDRGQQRGRVRIGASAGDRLREGPGRAAGQHGPLGVLRRGSVERAEGRGRLLARARHANIQSGFSERPVAARPLNHR